MGKGGVHPDQSDSPLQGHTETTNVKLKGMVLQSPIDVSGMVLDCWRKLEDIRIHTVQQLNEK